MIAARHKGREPTLLLTFHGTGGSEHQLHARGMALMPGAHVVSPRGEVSEGSMRRFFVRRADGSYDMEDLARRTVEVADFIAAEAARTGAARTVALGYSNGANILASVLMTRPEAMDEAVLLHPLIPFAPPLQPGIARKPILVTAGRHDPICPNGLTQSFADWLIAQGSSLTLLWHDGRHGIPPQEWAAVAAFLAPDRDEVLA